MNLQQQPRTITGAAQRASGSNGRVIRYTLSDSSVARDGHTIATGGWVLDNYKKNPIVLWAHDGSEPPIGRMVELGTVGDRLIGSVQYPEPDVYPFADTIYRLVSDGYLSGVSVSWLPIEWQYSRDPSRPGGIDFTRADLLEVSQVPVPALPSALVAARAAGINTDPLREWAERSLDGGRLANIPRKEPEQLRRAAKMPTRFSASAVRRFGQGGNVFSLSESAGFRCLGDQLHAVVRAENTHVADPRLVRAPIGLNESDPTAGGFAVQTDFSQEIIGSIYGEAVIAPLCDRRPTSSPSDTELPAVDETSRADGARFGGVVSYWLAEAENVSPSLPRWRRLQFSVSES